MYLSWNPWFREHFVNPRNTRRLRNHDVSIFCNNCVGAVISHDLGLQFRSPFVNVWLYPNDYLKFCENLQHYLSCNLDFISYNEVGYPVARLDDVTIFSSIIILKMRQKKVGKGEKKEQTLKKSIVFQQNVMAVRKMI